MFLIDTSVWIDYLRQRQTQPAIWFEEILDRDYPFGITGVIYPGECSRVPTPRPATGASRPT